MFLYLSLSLSLSLSPFLSDEDAKADTIAQAAASILEDVRTDISSPSEILGQLEVFREKLPDRCVRCVCDRYGWRGELRGLSAVFQSPSL
jgi:hypothetical protein